MSILEYPDGGRACNSLRIPYSNNNKVNQSLFIIRECHAVEYSLSANTF